MAQRHHRVRDTVAALAAAAGYTCSVEPELPVLGGPRGSPSRADLLVRLWQPAPDAEPQDLYLDFVGSSPLTRARLPRFRPGQAAVDAALEKDRKYASVLSLQPPEVAFLPFSFETLGGYESRAQEFLQQLQRGLEHSALARSGFGT